jgi:chromosome partitioning protein
MRVLSVVNLKGGTAKSTLATTLAVGAARKLPKDGRVLIVDGDPQGSASLIMGSDGQPLTGPSLRHVLLDEVQASEAIASTRIPRLDLLRSDGSLADCSALLAKETGREHRLRRALRALEEKYSLVIIDAPPQLSLISINILKAASELVVPVDAYLSIVGLGKLRETVAQVQDYLDHPDLTIIGLAIQRAMRNRQSKVLETELRAAYGPLVYQTVIPYAPIVEEATRSLRTVLETASASPVSLAFDKLITEILNAKPTRRPSGGAASSNGKAGAERPGRRREQGGEIPSKGATEKIKRPGPKQKGSKQRRGKAHSQR